MASTAGAGHVESLRAGGARRRPRTAPPYSEELVKAGVLLAAEGPQPSSKGARIELSGGKRTVTLSQSSVMPRSWTGVSKL